MEIAGVSSALSAVNASSPNQPVQSAVSMKMLDNTIELNEQLNKSMVQMMERSVNPAVGGHIDISL